VADYGTFIRSLGEELQSLLPGAFRNLPSKRMLRRERAGGADVIVFSASTASSPHVLLAFCFGRWFPEAAKVEARLGWQRSYYQVHQLSENAKSMLGLSFDGAHRWSLDITIPPPTLASEVARSIEQIALPFFERFTTLRDAQAAHASNDSWCLPAKGPTWRQMFTIDAALDDISHFRSWAGTLEPFYRRQADEALIQIGSSPEGS
jgi:hypothetical protein